MRLCSLALLFRRSTHLNNRQQILVCSPRCVQLFCWTRDLRLQLVIDAAAARDVNANVVHRRGAALTTAAEISAVAERCGVKQRWPAINTLRQRHRAHRLIEI